MQPSSMASAGERRHGGALAAVLIAMAVVVAVGLIAAIGAGLYIARNVTVREARGGKIVETPFGSVRVREGGRFDPAHFGVPVYPGAERSEDNRKLASFEFDFGDTHQEFSVIAAEYTTLDSADRVMAWYRDKLPHWLFAERGHGRVRFELTEGGHKRIVAIREHGGRTHIGLASVGAPASN